MKLFETFERNVNVGNKNVYEKEKYNTFLFRSEQNAVSIDKRNKEGNEGR